MLKKYLVEYEDEPIGIYYGTCAQEAIQECHADIASAKIQGYTVDFYTPGRERLAGMIAMEVEN